MIIIKKLTILSVVAALAACQSIGLKPQQTLKATINNNQTSYVSSIAQDGTSVVVKLANGQQRVVTSNLPTYSATIGRVNVQQGGRSFAIEPTQPTVTTTGKVTGSVFKPNAPEGAHWQLVKLNGQTVDSQKSKRPPYLRMVGGQMHGLTGCNVMSGIYHRDDKKMQFMRVQGTTTTETNQRMSSESAEGVSLDGIERGVELLYLVSDRRAFGGCERQVF
ncbi:MAG TPA: META domain-containing protein [Agitococcus sp.]|nr:META domain-containing protein [Agitococcus sp.]